MALSLFAKLTSADLKTNERPDIAIDAKADILLHVLSTEQNCGTLIKFIEENVLHDTLISRDVLDHPLIVKRLREATMHCMRHLIATLSGLEAVASGWFPCEKIVDTHPAVPHFLTMMETLETFYESNGQWETYEQVKNACKVIVEVRGQAKAFFTAPYTSEAALLLLDIRCPSNSSYETNRQEIADTYQNMCGRAMHYHNTTFPDGSRIVDFRRNSHFLQEFTEIEDLQHSVEQAFQDIGGHTEIMNRSPSDYMALIFRDRNVDEALRIFQKVQYLRYRIIKFHMWRYGIWRQAVNRRREIMKSARDDPIRNLVLRFREALARFL